MKLDEYGQVTKIRSIDLSQIPLCDEQIEWYNHIVKKNNKKCSFITQRGMNNAN